MRIDTWWESALFLTLALVSFVSSLGGLYGLWELRRVAQKRPDWFVHGLVVFSAVRAGPPRPPSGTARLECGWSSAVREGHIVFGPHFPLLTLERLPTPFPIKGTADVGADGWVVTGRLPTGPLVFGVGWMVAWLIGVVLQEEELGLKIGMLATGWLVAGGAMWMAVRLERRHFAAVVDCLFPD